MNWMKRHLIYINMVWASILLLGSCTSESGTGTPDVTPVVPSKPTNNTETAVSQDEITFQVTGKWEEAANTRMSTIDNTQALKDYDIAIDAYYHGTNTKFLGDKTLKFVTGMHNSWKFINYDDPVGNPGHFDIESYYWPIVGSKTTNDITVGTIDYVAYVPNTRPTYVSAISYNYVTGKPSFTCSLPITAAAAEDNPETAIDESQAHFDASNQSSLQEFMITSSINRGKDTDNSALGIENGIVPLQFQHPFAIVNIYLEKAKRGTVIKSVSLKDLNISGTFTYDGASSGWDLSAPTAYLAFLLNGTTGLTVPDNVNFNALLGGPFLVLPQTLLTPNNLVVNRKMPDDDSSTDQSATIAETWEAGKIYNYYLNLGDDPNDILVNVYVESWVSHTVPVIDVN